MNKNKYVENLLMHVLEKSTSKDWESAVKEWKILSCRIDKKQNTMCVCGKENLKYLFEIYNEKNGNKLFPIGSTCIKKFERDELNTELVVYEDMFKLVSAVENREYIELSPKYFSRKLLKYLYDNGVFTSNKYNDFDAKNDYIFMLKIFNKREKEEITERMQKKVNGLIRYCVLPFIHRKIKNMS